MAIYNGWSVDLSDVATGETGTNTVIATLGALATARAAAGTTPVDPVLWQSAVRDIHAHMSSMTAEEFLDGPNGAYIAPMLTALGITNTVPDAPFQAGDLQDFSLSASQTTPVTVGVPDWVPTPTYAWTIVAGGGGATTISSGGTTATVTLAAHATTKGTDTLRCVVTSQDGSTSTVECDITV